MNVKRACITCLAALSCWLVPFSALQARQLVKVIAEENLYNNITPEINQYLDDLQTEGYAISLSIGSWSDPADIRVLLQDEQENGLIGSVLIGQIPLVQFNIPEKLHESYRHDFYTPMYYMDLDGDWGGLDDGVYTTHTGDTEAEIWVGLIRAESLPAAEDEASLLRQYFTRIHNYRNGLHYAPPKRAFRFYQTILPNYEDLEQIYDDIDDSGCETDAAGLLQRFNDAQGYEMAVINTSSGSSVHHFHKQPCWPLSEEYWTTDHKDGDVDANCPDTPIDCPDGDCDIDYQDILSADPKILFYHLATSETGRFDQENNLSGHYIFSSNYALAALAATQHTIVGDHFYDEFGAGLTFGEAYRRDMNAFTEIFNAEGNTSTEWCPDWDPGGAAERLTQAFYAALIIGDPTLKLPGLNVSDENPPQISAVEHVNVTGTSATITWLTDDNADSQVEYGLTTDYGQASVLDPTFEVDHTIDLNNLTPNTIYHYRVLSRDVAGNLAVSDEYTFTSAEPDAPLFLQRVNVGGDSYVDPQNQVWEADQKYVSGSWGYDDNKTGVGSSSDAVANTKADVLYHTNRYRIKNYRFTVPSSDIYTVELHFAETYYDEPGKRVFDVSLEGVKVLDDLDVIAEAGHDVALVRTFDVEVTDGRLDVTFRNVVENAMISAIEVKLEGDDETPPVIANVQEIDISPTSARIIWDTDEASDSQIEYGLSSNFGNVTALDPALVTDHAQDLNSLQPATTYHYRVFSRDAEGNLSSSGAFTFTTLPPDETPPVISDVAILKIFTDSVTVSWNTDEIADSQIEFGLDENYGALTDLDPALVSNHVHGVGGLTSNTLYHFRIRSQDAGGNLGTSADFTFATLQSDETPPVISNVAADNITSASATISWNTDEPADTQVEYGLDANYGNSTIVGAALKTSHSHALSGLAPNAVYHYRVISSDESGNLAESGDFTFTTLPEPQSTFVQRVNVGGDAFTGSDGRVWDADQPKSGNSWGYEGARTGIGSADDPISDTNDDALYHTNRYRLDRYRFELENGTYFVQLLFAETYYAETGKRKFNVEIENQQVIGALDIVAEAGHDAALVFNFTTQVNDGELTIEFERVLENPLISAIEVRSETDGTPPLISNVSSENIGETTATISWRTDEPADSHVEYGLDANYGNISALDPALVVSHSHALSGLQPGVTYHFRVFSRDANGNLATSGDFTFTTTAPDVAPPVITEVSAGQISVASAKITWATDEAADSQIEYGVDTNYGNLTALNPALVTNHGQSLTNLTAGTTYHYRVHSKDARGNQATSKDFTFTTLPPDETPPTLSNVTVIEIFTDSVSVTWETDEASDSQIEFGQDVNYGNLTLPDPDLVTTHAHGVGGLIPGTIYHFRALSRDESRNLGMSRDFTFTTHDIDATPPSISNVSEDNVTSSSATISWDTDEPSDSQIEYGLDENYGDLTPLNANLVSSHSQNLSGLSPNRTYHYRVISKDESGNRAVSANFTFTTAVEPTPTFVQRVNVGGEAFTGDDGRVWDADQAKSGNTWGHEGARTGVGSANDAISNTNDDALYQSNRYRLDRYRFELENGVYFVELHFAETYYAESGKRKFDVEIEDQVVLSDLDLIEEVGHDAAFVFNFTTEVSDGELKIEFNRVLENPLICAIEVRSEIDDAPPVISNVTANGVTQSSATISWLTNEPADSQVEYGLDAGYGNESSLNPALTNSHGQQLSGLQPNTTYHFRVHSKDASGNAAASSDFTFTTLPPDETPPVISNVIVNGVTSSSATVSWGTDEASDSQIEHGLDDGYGNSTALDPALVTAHNQAITGLEANTIYHYRVISTDAAGNTAISGDFTFATAERASWAQRVNAGGGSYTGSDGRFWQADQEFSDGSWGYDGSRTGLSSTNDNIANASDDALYQTNRYRLDGYHFTVPEAATYAVQLCFAETYYKESGKRRFDVDIEGERVLNGLDIHAVAGHDAALVYNFEVFVDDGVLEIEFGRVLENPLISAIEVAQKESDSQAKRILLVGNSITDGVGSSDGLGFRPELYNLLNSAGEDVEFIGPEGVAPYEGHFYSGKSIEDFYPSSFGNGSGSGEKDLAGTMGLYQPQFVMIHLGTNDLSNETSLTPYSEDGGQTMALTTSGEMGDLVNYVLQWRNGIKGNFVEHVFVSRIIPRGDRESQTAELNDEIARLINDFANGAITGAPEPVRLVDHHTPFDSNPDLFTGNGNDYMVEDLHPNDRGYDVMAETWFDAYAAVIGVESAAILAAKDGRRRMEDVAEVLTPIEFKLSQNYPNPFSARSQHTWIKFQLAKDATTVLEVYDLLGRRVRTLVNDAKPAGFYQIAWDGRNESGLPVSSGIYYYVLRSQDFVKSLRMTVVR